MPRGQFEFTSKKKTSIPKKVIAREIRSRAGELKTGMKGEFDPVEVPLCPETQNRRCEV
jgi:hypothetical protein